MDARTSVVQNPAAIRTGHRDATDRFAVLIDFFETAELGEERAREAFFVGVGPVSAGYLILTPRTFAKGVNV